MDTDQRRSCPHLTALEILNEVLNDASTVVVVMKHLYDSDERQCSTSGGEEEDGDIFPK